MPAIGYVYPPIRNQFVLSLLICVYEASVCVRCAVTDQPYQPHSDLVPDPQGHLRRCESNREYQLRQLGDVGLETVYNAIKIGYRHLESFCDYQNEKEAGEGVRRAIKDGLVRREDICELSRYLGSGYRY